MDGMRARAKANHIKNVRFRILETLEMVYPGPLSGAGIADAIAFLEVDDDDLRKDLAYLCEKNYLVALAATIKHAWERRDYRLTATGKELVDRVRSDSALEI